jgi:demethylmenaquinone methyltransferase / 2-methoxy-6-polyprenyl-1,4-benzoquinol methylase
MSVERVLTPRKRQALELFEGLPRRYDELAAARSFWQDPRWRRAMVATVQASRDDRLLDVAAGTGLVAAELVRRYGCRVTALDQSAAMLSRARVKLAADPELASRVELVEGEAERLPFADAEFDHLTFTYLLRYVDDPAATLRELARVVRPGGRISSLEFCVPRGPLLWAWRLYTRVGLPSLGRLAGRDWYAVGRFLGPSIEGFYAEHPLPRQLDMWREAGIRDLSARRMSLGGGIVIWGTRDGG